MASKELHFNVDARAGLKRGVDQLAEAVKVTLGPRGRNVVIDKTFGAPTITKDGVTVGANPMAIKRGIEQAVHAVVEELKKISVPTSGKKEIAQIGSISANND